MNSARMGHSATLISGCTCQLDGDVLLAGGNGGLESVSPDREGSDAPPLNSAELYDYRTDSFIAIPSQMITPREEAIASAIPSNGGKILIAGGDSKGIFQNSIADAEIFDPTTQLHRDCSDEFVPRVGPCGGAGSVVGERSVSRRHFGSRRPQHGRQPCRHLAESRRSFTIRFRAHGKLTRYANGISSCALHSMTLLSSGPDAGTGAGVGGALLQGTGGLKNLSRNSVASAELFNPADGTFSKVAGMSAPRSAHSAVVLEP